MQIKNHFDKIRLSVDKKEKVIIDETTAESTRIQKFNNEKIMYLFDLQARNYRDIEAAEKQKNMNDLYNTGIDLPCLLWHLNIEGQCLFTVLIFCNFVNYFQCFGQVTQRKWMLNYLISNLKMENKRAYFNS